MLHLLVTTVANDVLNNQTAVLVEVLPSKYFTAVQVNFFCQYAMPLKAACETLGRALQDLLRNPVWEESLLYLAICDKLFLSFQKNIRK
jgi:hypothetical protein